MMSVFFLQAEDGIRDADVTGVQTCALPISAQHAGNLARGRRGKRRAAHRQFSVAAAERRAEESCVPRAAQRRGAGEQRSEERRVGKSVDLGGRRIIKKKKKRNIRMCYNDD